MADYEINWRPIETAPRDGTDVLIYYGGKDSHPSIGPCEAYWDGDCWITASGEWGEMLGFWFWQPLTEPPVGDWEWPGGQGTAEQIKQYKALGEIAKSEPAKDGKGKIEYEKLEYLTGDALRASNHKLLYYAREAELKALRAENARLRESAELNADYHRREMKLQTEIASLALEESSAIKAENARLRGALEETCNALEAATAFHYANGGFPFKSSKQTLKQARAALEGKP